MENKTMFVKVTTDSTVVVNVPEIPFHRTWKKRGAKFPVDRSVMLQAYYDPSVEFLFREGLLTTDDTDFLKEVGLMDDDGNAEIVVLDEALMKRYIHTMPLYELKEALTKLSRSQIAELAEFAIAHYTELQVDRIDMLSKASGKNIMKAIENLKASSEE